MCQPNLTVAAGTEEDADLLRSRLEVPDSTYSGGWRTVRAGDIRAAAGLTPEPLRKRHSRDSLEVHPGERGRMLTAMWL